MGHHGGVKTSRYARAGAADRLVHHIAQPVDVIAQPVDVADGAVLRQCMPWVKAEVVAGEILLGDGRSPAAARCRRPSRMERWPHPTDAGVLDGQLVPGVLPHLQGKAGGRAVERHRRAAIDTNGLTPVAQRAGVVGRAGHIQIGATALSILVAGKADRQVAGVQRSGLLRGIDQKAEAGKVVGRGEPVPAEG